MLRFTPSFVKACASGAAAPRKSPDGVSTARLPDDGATVATIARTTDAETVNRWINAPDIRPFIGAADLGEVDAAESVAKPENLYLFGEHGGFALTWSAPGVYEVHTLIGSHGRGRWAYRAAQQMIDTAQDAGARLLWTRIAPAAANVAAFAKHFGMKPAGMAVEALGERYDVYSMEIA